MSALALRRMPCIDTSAGFGGIGLRTFRIAAGADRAVIRDVAERMRRDYLSRQPEFVDHVLLSDGAGGYAELMYADSRESAIDLHEGLMTHPDHLVYLDTIEPSSARLSFWRRL